MMTIDPLHKVFSLPRRDFRNSYLINVIIKFMGIFFNRSRSNKLDKPDAICAV